MMLNVRNLTAGFRDRKIIKDVSISIKKRHITALMGPNASGKSTLCKVIMGEPHLKVFKGTIEVNGKNIIKLKTFERSKIGLFLVFQNPVAINGVSIESMLWNSFVSTNRASQKIFRKRIEKAIKMLGINRDFLKKGLNVSLSGGEKKISEILQLLVVKPKIVMIDEIDSGLDVDLLKKIARIINGFKKHAGILLITHYRRILEYIDVSTVYIMVNGRIVDKGGVDIVEKIERKGYRCYK